MDAECCNLPGSFHDTNVFTSSSICKRLCSSDLSKIFQTISNIELKIPNYLIGDPEDPLVPYCMRQYSTCKLNEEVVFSVMLRNARNPIECAFGRPKARWQVLTKKIDFKLEKIPDIIYAACMLHTQTLCCIIFVNGIVFTSIKNK